MIFLRNNSDCKDVDLYNTRKRYTVIENSELTGNGSVDFLLNAITIQSLEKYLKTFYTPPLDIDQISSIWDQILCNPKTMVTVAEEVWQCARKVSIIQFSIFMSMFHQCVMERRFLELTL